MHNWSSMIHLHPPKPSHRPTPPTPPPPAHIINYYTAVVAVFVHTTTAILFIFYLILQPSHVYVWPFSHHFSLTFYGFMTKPNEISSILIIIIKLCLLSPVSIFQIFVFTPLTTQFQRLLLIFRFSLPPFSVLISNSSFSQFKFNQRTHHLYFIVCTVSWSSFSFSSNYERRHHC